MNYNQNKKIAQITPYTLIIGVDIVKFKHMARAQDFRVDPLVISKIQKKVLSIFFIGFRKLRKHKVWRK